MSLRGGTTKQEPHPTLSKGECFKKVSEISSFGGDLEGAYCRAALAMTSDF